MTSSSPLVLALEALAHATPESFLGAVFPVARPEDLLVYKIFAWRAQDQQDAERLLLLHGSTMDLDRVRRILAELLEATGEADRMPQFEALVKRCLP